jgi:DNA helicase II / ATP-dependent DNA helicase PcrA
VAVAPAKDRLYVTFPLRYDHRQHALGDGHSYAQLSRFLPPELFPLFGRAGCGFGEQEQPAPPAGATDVAKDVRDRVRRLRE